MNSPTEVQIAPEGPVGGGAQNSALSALHAEALDLLNEAVAITTTGGSIVYANRAITSLFGYAADEILGQPISILGVPELTAESGRELVASKKDGTIIHVEHRAKCCKLDGGSYWLFAYADLTFHVEAELSEVRAKAVIDCSDDAILTKSLDGIITSWNKGAERIFGYTADEVIGRHISMLAAPGREDEIPFILNRLRRGEHIDHYETLRRTKDGRIIDVSLTVSPLRNSAGEIIGASKIARDITSRKLIESALGDRERELLLLIEASSALLASPNSPEVLRKIIDLAQRFISADAHAVWRKVSSTDWVLVHSSGLSDAYIKQARMSAAMRIASEPLIHRMRDTISGIEPRRAAYEAEGIKVVLAVPLLIREQPSGTVVYYWKSEHEILEPELRVSKALANLAAAALSAAELYEGELLSRERAESSEQRAKFLAEAGLLLSSSLEYETTLSNVTKLAVPTFADWCAVDVVSDTGAIVRVAMQHSDPARIDWAHEFRRKYFGREDDPSKLVMNTGQAFLFEDIPDELLVKSARSEEHLSDLRTMNIRSCILAPLRAGEEIAGVITFAHSESGRHYAPDDLRVAEEIGRRAGIAIVHARLFHEVKRVASQLRVSNEQLRHLNEDLKQFAYSASHDLQEPLRMVTIYTQLLERKYGQALDDKARQYMSFTVGSAKRMEMMLRDLLAYTVAASEDSDEALTAVSADAVVDRVLLNLQTIINESGAIFERTRLPRVRVREVHLVQVLQNLIGNAIKYRRKDRTLRISISASETSGVVTFSVSDNGIGIPEHYHRQIFGLFKRLHGADQYAGTGIGLAICQRLIHRYGGQIWVESKEGEGSTFRFTLPAASASSSREQY